jgi:hypothetical protein
MAAITGQSIETPIPPPRPTGPAYAYSGSRREAAAFPDPLLGTVGYRAAHG